MMANFVRAYLRASTKEQNAERAKASLLQFTKEHKVEICNWYIENESGAKLQRPELFRLLDDCHNDDILLIEDIDRLSRLNAKDWDKLKQLIKSKSIRIVAVNVPTTWSQVKSSAGDFDSRILAAINDMLIEMLAAIARRDYEQRRERQAQGIAKAKTEGKYVGRKANTKQYQSILRLLDSGHTYREIEETLSCSSSTIARAKVWKKENDKSI